MVGLAWTFLFVHELVNVNDQPDGDMKKNSDEKVDVNFGSFASQRAKMRHKMAGYIKLAHAETWQRDLAQLLVVDKNEKRKTDAND